MQVVESGTRGGGVTVVVQALKLILMAVSLMVLSRMLPPEDFGLVAMTTAIVLFGELLSDMGLSLAGLQARELSKEQSSNLFWANTAMGALGAAVIGLGAPVLVWFYDEPRLALITPVLASTLLINGLQAQFRVQLARSHRYKALSFTDLGSQFLGVLTAVVVASAGFGYWALVAQALVAALALFLLRSMAAEWRPGRPSRGVGTGALLRKGVDYMGTQVLTFVASSVDTVVIGARWGPQPLGLYNRAFQLFSLPVSKMMSPLTQVVLPAMNASRDSGRSVFRDFLRLQSIVGTFAIGVFAVAFCVADALVPLVLGPGWEAVVPLFQILAVGGSVQGVSTVGHWIFLSEGSSRKFLHYNLVTKTLSIVLVVLASFISLEAVAWAVSLSLVVSWPINLVWLHRTAGLPGWTFFGNGVRLLGAGYGAAAVTWLIGATMELDGVWHLLANGALCASIFLCLIITTRAGRSDLVMVRRISRLLLGRI